MQKILTFREKIILYLTIGVFIFSIVFNLLIVRALSRNSVLNKEISIAKIKLNKYTRLLAQKDVLQNKYNKFTSGIRFSYASNDTMVSALAELEALAKKSNIYIIDIRPQTSENFDLYQEALIDLRIEGNLAGYLKFIYDIENSLSLLRIKKFQISAKPNTQALEGTFLISAENLR